MPTFKSNLTKVTSSLYESPLISERSINKADITPRENNNNKESKKKIKLIRNLNNK